MLTHLTRIGTGAAVVLGLAALGVIEGEALAQGMSHGNSGFRFNQGSSMMGAGSVKGYVPGAGGGFSYSGPGGLPMGSYGMMTSNPFSSITSSPGGSDTNSAYGGSGSYNQPDPYGGYLTGAASVIGATGRLGVDSQRAYLVKEKVRAAQVENRRRLFDEWLYERANTPTLQDDLERIQKREVRRSRFDPAKTEIWSAKAINDILEDLKRLDRSKVSGGNVTIEPSVLEKINLTSGKGNINLGVLKNDGDLEKQWPVVLRDTTLLGDESAQIRQRIQTKVKEAYGDAKRGQPVDVGKIKYIRDNIAELERLVRANTNKMGYTEYTAAKTFLNQLKDGVNLLADKNAPDYVKGKYSLSMANLNNNNTVADVVKYMQDNGLQFAPAVDGEQEAYLALYRALASYDNSASSLAAQ